jgi:hypothetical protein
MRTLSIILMSVVSLGSFAATSQAGPYDDYHRERYLQGLARMQAAVANVQAIRRQLITQRNQFNEDITSPDPRVKARAKQTFLNYMCNLNIAYSRAVDTTLQAAHLGLVYAYSLEQTRRTAPQGRAVRIQAGVIHNQGLAMRRTQGALQTEAENARRRR